MGRPKITFDSTQSKYIIEIFAKKKSKNDIFELYKKQFPNHQVSYSVFKRHYDIIKSSKNKFLFYQFLINKSFIFLTKY